MYIRSWKCHITEAGEASKNDAPYRNYRNIWYYRWRFVMCIFFRPFKMTFWQIISYDDRWYFINILLCLMVWVIRNMWIRKWTEICIWRTFNSNTKYYWNFCRWHHFSDVSPASVLMTCPTLYVPAHKILHRINSSPDIKVAVSDSISPMLFSLPLCYDMSKCTHT